MRVPHVKVARLTASAAAAKVHPQAPPMQAHVQVVRVLVVRKPAMARALACLPILLEEAVERRCVSKALNFKA